MSTHEPIICPIATNETTTATLNPRWFVQGTEYPPVGATFEPLVNGERAFGAVYDAIMAAKSTVELVCWGFQPSMYFKRGDKESLCIGELLKLKGKEGVKIRILAWGDSLHLAQFLENMSPGDNLASYFRPQTRNVAQYDYDNVWYSQARLSNTGANKGVVELGQRFFNMMKNGHSAEGYLENIEFVVRDFGVMERAEIAWHVSMRADDADRSAYNKFLSAFFMTTAPTHHQKMVLVDYECPEQAVGFVMGHNTLDEYWDTDEHRYHAQEAQRGRNGFGPRQDISSRVTGKILEHLNHNFCEAWKKETKVDLLLIRSHVASRLMPREDMARPLLAQVLRTQAQEGVRDIKKLYLKAANNVTKFIYIENQYFRWEPLAATIKDAAQKQLEWGREHSQHGSVHLFVVTNSSEDGMGTGTVNTYRMLESLGRSDVLPEVSRLERNDQLRVQMNEANDRVANAHKAMKRFNRSTTNHDDPEVVRTKQILHEELESAKARQEELVRALPEEKQKPILPVEIPGLKVHICTLVAPDSPPDNWMEVYIHSKLMIVDDVFTTLGSTNINTRSMEVDSELNVCIEEPSVTRPLRQHLWNVHTDGLGAQDDSAEAFESWAKIIDENNDRRTKNKVKGNAEKRGPYASLVEFFRDSSSRTNLD